MKHLTFLFPILLVLLSPTVLSQGRFNFVMKCRSERKNAKNVCKKLLREIKHTGEVIESNLVLNTNIAVDVIYGTYGGPELIGSATPILMKYISPQDQVERLYPTALLKQLNTGINFEKGPDIVVFINSEKQDKFWFPGDGDIKHKQVDMSLVFLHEMMHGLGFIATWEFPPDRKNNYITPRLNGGFDRDEDDTITFDGFYETIFDANLVQLESAKRITDIAQSLNGFTQKGTKFDDGVEDLFDTFEESDQVDDARLMLEYATTRSALAFIPSDSPNSPFILDTSRQSFDPASSISHFDHDTFINTADFLMVPATDGTTLQAQLQRTGNSPGGGIGPKLRSVLKTLGYTINENPPMGSNPPQKRRL